MDEGIIDPAFFIAYLDGIRPGFAAVLAAYADGLHIRLPTVRVQIADAERHDLVFLCRDCFFTADREGLVQKRFPRIRKLLGFIPSETAIGGAFIFEPTEAVMTGRPIVSLARAIRVKRDDVIFFVFRERVAEMAASAILLVIDKDARGNRFIFWGMLKTDRVFHKRFSFYIDYIYYTIFEM